MAREKKPIQVRRASVAAIMNGAVDTISSLESNVHQTFSSKNLPRVPSALPLSGPINKDDVNLISLNHQQAEKFILQEFQFTKLKLYHKGGLPESIDGLLDIIIVQNQELNDHLDHKLPAYEHQNHWLFKYYSNTNKRRQAEKLFSFCNKYHQNYKNEEDFKTLLQKIFEHRRQNQSKTTEELIRLHYYKKTIYKLAYMSIYTALYYINPQFLCAGVISEFIFKKQFNQDNIQQHDDNKFLKILLHQVLNFAIINSLFGSYMALYVSLLGTTTAMGVICLATLVSNIAIKFDCENLHSVVDFFNDNFVYYVDTILDKTKNILDARVMWD